jgi:hypothetical protein
MPNRNPGLFRSLLNRDAKTARSCSLSSAKLRFETLEDRQLLTATLPLGIDSSGLDNIAAWANMSPGTETSSGFPLDMMLSGVSSDAPANPLIDSPETPVTFYNGNPYIYLGTSDNMALDQPRVAIEVIDEGPPVESVGPTAFNTYLLDTGANSVLAFASSVAAMNDLEPGLEIEGTFEEAGVAGTDHYDISAAYRFDFAGTSGERNTLTDARILAGDQDVSMFGPWGIMGMPAMAERVTTLDMSVWSGDDFTYMEVFFDDVVPTTTGQRFSVPLDNRFTWEPEAQITSGNYPPVWADVPFLTAAGINDGTAYETTFLLDTGAQLSVMSETMAFGMNLDSNGDGLLDENDDNFARYETVGGVGGQISAPVFLFDEFHVPTTQGADLVWTDLQWLVLDIAGGQFGIFGSDLLTSGWLEPFFGMASEPGYFDKVHFDFTDFGMHPDNRDQNGLLHFDINPNLGQVTDLSVPDAVITETDRYTMASESGNDDVYQITLTQQPSADVRINLTTDLAQLNVEDAANPGNTYLVFTSTNWNVPQTVNVSAVNDGLPEGFHRSSVYHTSVSADLDFHEMDIRHLLTNINDLDYAGVMTLPNNDTTDVVEGGVVDTYQIVLTGQPTSDVKIELLNGYGQVSAVDFLNPGNSFVTFNSSNWNVPQTILVTAVDDTDIEDDHRTRIMHRLVTSDFTYQSTYAFPKPVYITDNDVDLGEDLFIDATTGDDDVKIWPGTPGGTQHRVQINSLDAYYDAAVYDAIYIDGLGGTDTLSVYGKATTETATFNETSVQVSESSVYNVFGTSFENAYVYSGGGADAATMLGTSGNDNFYVNQTYSYLRGNSNAFLNYAKNFATVTADASAGSGTDRVYMYDSSGDDILIAGETQATLDYDSTASPGVDVTAIGFGETSAYAVNGGVDDATLTGSSGNDRFTARDLYGRMQGNAGAFIHYAEGFAQVTGDVSGTTGTDVAVLFDGSSDDHLDAGETSVSIDLGATPGVSDPNLIATGFDQTYAYAIRGGNDTALMTGSNSADQLTSKRTYSTLKRRDGAYFNYATGWDQVTADVSAGSGADIAFIYDDATDDTFEAGPSQATFDYDSTGSPGIDTTVIGFGEVYAYADNGGTDSATLTGSANADKYYGLAAYSYFKAVDDSFFNYARGFDAVTANAVGSGDLAFMYGSDGNDVLNAIPTSAAFTLNPTAGGQVVNTAATFDQVYAYASGGGTDKAYLTGTAGADTLVADMDWGYLRSTGSSDYFNYVRYFDEVFADPGDTDIGNDLLDDRGATYTLGTDPGNGNVW